MPYLLTIPARINILGNPGDANEGDFATISAAVNLHAGAIISDGPGLVLELLDRSPLDPSIPAQTIARLEYRTDQVPLPYNGDLDLLIGAVNRLHRFSAEFRDRFREAGVRITVWSQVPRQSGLGGSSLLVLLTLAGLRQCYNLDPHAHNDYILAELAQRVEAGELGITCGYADRYVPLFGGLAYLDYRGKLLQTEIRDEPFVTYERLDGIAGPLPMVAVSTGVLHDSGEVHGKMRPRYVEEYLTWQRGGGEAPPMVKIMTDVWETAWRGKIALLEGDLPTFGALMNENHRLVNQMMVYAGFRDGAGWANNLLIETALQNGALGAKLTGAGGGGSVFALVRPGEEDRLENAWRLAVQDANLSSAWIYRPGIEKEGLRIQRIGSLNLT
ncbi:MAG: hypothetical protein EHM70_12540 [Chloroflexota bacterium]|nr:MAG: hypothetical protein EHM70_12540 [Chloroflexota bacterium]